MLNLAIGDSVDFQLIANGINNSTFKRCVYQGNVGYTVAIGIDQSINEMHNAFLPYFKDRYPTYLKPNAYQYATFILPNGNLVAIGEPWIMDGTLVIDSNRQCVINIANYRGLMESPLRDLLGSLGASYTFDVK